MKTLSSGVRNMYIGYWTLGIMGENINTIETIKMKFEAIKNLIIAKEIAMDWFYEIKVYDKKFFVVDNGENGYTAMLPREY